MEYILVGMIIGGIIWGIVVNKVIENKGYKENWFWWGFFFGFFALIVALTKQNVNTTKVVIAGTSQPEEKSMELLSNKNLNERVNISSPVHIASWEIKKDTEKLVLFVDFINVSHKAISAVMLSATGFNAFGDIVRVNDAEFFDVIGQDLTVKPNAYGKIYTILQDDAIRKVEVRVKKICFADGTIVDDIPENWINTNQNALNPIHTECAKIENAEAKYYSIINEEYWQCVCGFVNVGNSCNLCNVQKSIASKFTINSFQDTYRSYLEQLEIEKCAMEKHMLEEKQAKDKRTKQYKLIAASTLSFIAICIVAFLFYNLIIPNVKYNKAIKLMNEEYYGESMELLLELGDYKNCKQLLKTLLQKEHGEAREYYQQFKRKIFAGADYAIGVKTNRKVLYDGNEIFENTDIKRWKNIASISTGFSHAVGLTTDGTLVAVGDNYFGECDVSDWKDIVEVAAGFGHTVGLKKDGTVLATGINKQAQCDVETWENIISIAANGYYTIGLKSDGTVVSTKNKFQEASHVTSWLDIVEISAGEDHVVGLKSDGTAVSVGKNNRGQSAVSSWKNIVAISAGSQHTVGLKSDGMVVATGDNTSAQCSVDEWENIIAVAAGNNYTLGLKADGTLVSTSHATVDVSNWDLID